jgi:hypothetical protein
MPCHLIEKQKIVNNGINSDFKKLGLFKTSYPRRSRRLASPGIAALTSSSAAIGQKIGT